jgi:hypothetical protein
MFSHATQLHNAPVTARRLERGNFVNVNFVCCHELLAHGLESRIIPVAAHDALDYCRLDWLYSLGKAALSRIVGYIV